MASPRGTRLQQEGSGRPIATAAPQLPASECSVLPPMLPCAYAGGTPDAPGKGQLGKADAPRLEYLSCRYRPVCAGVTRLCAHLGRAWALGYLSTSNVSAQNAGVCVPLCRGCECVQHSRLVPCSTPMFPDALLAAGSHWVAGESATAAGSAAVAQTQPQFAPDPAIWCRGAELHDACCCVSFPAPRAGPPAVPAPRNGRAWGCFHAWHFLLPAAHAEPGWAPSAC